jgi:hypothetical protein
MTKNRNPLTTVVTFIVFSCILFLASSSALAEMDIITYETDNGFTLSAVPGTVESCLCATAIDSLTVTNNGQFASSYTLSSSELFVTPSEGKLELLPKASKTLQFQLQASCDKEWTKPFTITVTDVYGNTQSYTKEFSVKRCQNLEATLATSADQAVGPCTPVTYEVAVKNSGVITETYTVAFGDESTDAAFDKPLQTLTLLPDQTGIAKAVFTPACDVYGALDMVFAVEAKHSDLGAELSHTLTILPDYSYDVTFQPVEACAFDVLAIPLVVTNDASFTRIFTLTLDEKSIVSLNQQEITLAPGASAEVLLQAIPSIDQAGSHTTSVTLTPSVGEPKTIAVPFTVGNCYAASLNIDVQEDVIACAGSYSYPVILKNTGTKEETLSLSVIGTSASLSEQEATLSPGEEQEITLTLDHEMTDSIEETVTVQVRIVGTPIVANDTFKATFLNGTACHQPLLTPVRASIPYGGTTASFILKNDGLDTTSYTLSYDGASWLSLDLEDRFVVLDPQEQAVIGLVLQEGASAPNMTGGTFTITTKDSDGATLTYLFPTTVKLQDRAFSLKLIDFVGEYPCRSASIFLLLLIAVLIYCVLAREPHERKSGRALLVTLVFIWVAALLSFLITFGTPSALYPEVASGVDPLVVRFAEDSTTKIDLSSYFTDPDLDNMTFAVTDMDDVLVEVDKKNIATFRPKDDWAGERRFRIIAYDGNGGETESPRMVLQVVDMPDYTLLALYEQYCGVINLALLLLAFLLVWQVFRPLRKVLPPVARHQGLKSKKKY